MREKQKKRNREFLLEELARSLQKHALLRAGDRVGVAVSGGADSVALLFLLWELRERLGIVLRVVHFNHTLRGRASDADEKFVAKLAKRLAIPFLSGRADIQAKAKRERANLEDAARRGRYDFFSGLVRQEKLTLIATAHTADDQAETVLAHILRGTGLAGLAGIHRQAEHIVRPLLDMRRTELREFLRARKQTWREDASNRDLTKTRARIRKKLIPFLEKQFQSEVVAHLAQLAEFAREDEALLDQLAGERMQATVSSDGDRKRIAIGNLLQPGVDTLVSNSVALTSRLVRRIVEDVKTGEGQISAHHVEAILKLAREGKNGKLLLLPGGVEVRRERESLVFLGPLRSTTSAVPRSARTTKRNSPSERQETPPQASAPRAYQYNIDLLRGAAAVRVPELGCAFSLREIDWTAKRGETSYVGAVLDRRRLEFPLVLRNWRPGDRFWPAGHRNAHKMKRLLNEKRVSRWERDGWPVLTSGGTLVWARGFPVATAFAASDATQIGIVITEDKHS
jgi:tRNA(Ile)-lysidine synthase